MQGLIILHLVSKEQQACSPTGRAVLTKGCLQSQGFIQIRGFPQKGGVVSKGGFIQELNSGILAKCKTPIPTPAIWTAAPLWPPQPYSLYFRVQLRLCFFPAQPRP